MSIRSRLLPALIGLAACASPEAITSPVRSTGPGPSLARASESELGFLRNAPTAPPLAATSVSFWAHTAEDREASISYAARPGALDSTQFVRFRVEKGALKTRPDGSAFAPTDSVLITITIADSARLIVDLQPAGLQFDPKRPAKIWFNWTEADRDRNRDGVIDAVDDSLTLTSAIWKQESANVPWESLKTSVDLGHRDYSAKVLGFTRYAVAY